MSDKWSVSLRRQALAEIKEYAVLPAMRIVQRLVLLPHLGKAHCETPFSEIPVLPRLFAFACTILISHWSFFPACKNVGSFATSRASAHRAAKKTKSSKERRSGRLLVAYRSTRIDLKCLARKFVGKLITFAGCDLIAQVVNGPVRCIEGDRIEQQRPHWPPVGHKHFVCGSQTPVCIE